MSEAGAGGERGRRPRVLVVDDDFAVAMLHRGFVEAHGGFTVAGVANNGAEALRLVDELEPDLVLLDIYLPDMTGLDVITAIRGRRGAQQVDIIAITAARELETVRAAMAGGVLHYLVKPFSAEVLRNRLDDYLRHRAELQRTSGVAGLDQEQVDRLLGGRPGATRTPLPKGLSARTLDLVSEALAGSDGTASAQEVADRVGVSRVSARRYLEHLVERGQARLEPRYGGTGRPEHRYRWLR